MGQTASAAFGSDISTFDMSASASRSPTYRAGVSWNMG